MNYLVNPDVDHSVGLFLAQSTDGCTASWTNAHTTWTEKNLNVFIVYTQFVLMRQDKSFSFFGVDEKLCNYRKSFA